MRKILFRGKRKDNGEWVDGNLVQSKDISVIFPKDALKGKTLFTSTLKENGEIEFRYEVDPETVCQYTGLTDKNGTKIFEGDIVSAPFTDYAGKTKIKNGVVEFVKGAFSVNWNDSEEYGKNFVGYVNDIEVIGNIFDNPELIGDQP